MNALTQKVVIASENVKNAVGMKSSHPQTAATPSGMGSTSSYGQDQQLMEQ